MKTLECMRTSMDGAHRGLADWYPEIEKGIMTALEETLWTGEGWTTDWYCSKHELASCKITCQDKTLTIEASVTDDFDTQGLAQNDIPLTNDLEIIRETIYATWDEAVKDQKSNRQYEGWSIIKGRSWVETYIAPSGDGLCYDNECPPGDNYNQWYWQEECDLPDHVKETFVTFINSCEGAEMEYKGYTLKKWD